MDVFRLIFFTAVVVIALALVRSIRALGDLRLWRRLTRNPSQPVRDLAQGPAIVRGRVKLVGEPLALPGSNGETCVAYEIAEPIRLGSTRQAASFSIVDETGAIDVRPLDMRVAAPVDRVLYVDKIGMKTLPGLARPMRVLRDGDEVVLVGMIQREADVAGQSGNYRDAPTKLVMRPGGPVGLAAVRDVSSLIRYAAPTLTISAAVIFVALAGIGIGGWVFVLGLR